jgi:hypothetical protein
VHTRSEVKQEYEIEKVIWTSYQSIFVSFHKSIKVSVNLSLSIGNENTPLPLMIRQVHLIDIQSIMLPGRQQLGAID